MTWCRYGCGTALTASRGGLFTCSRDDGSLISTHKYLWSQCRAVWTFAALYNLALRPSFERRDERHGLRCNGLAAAARTALGARPVSCLNARDR